jgi:predicted transcriptional regulator
MPRVPDDPPDDFSRWVSLARVRLVWAAVTAEPCAPIRTLARRLGFAPCVVHNALLVLRGAGYIDFSHGAKRARTIVVGLYPQGRIIE